MNRLFLNSNRTEYNELYCILRTALLKGTNELPIFVLLSLFNPLFKDCPENPWYIWMLFTIEKLLQMPV